MSVSRGRKIVESPSTDPSKFPELTEEILRLKEEKEAIILAHNYQRPEIQDIADYVGDSLGLSQTAAETDAKLIVFCGVHFMAETAAILCPDRKVLIPDLDAGCSLADMITAKELKAWKEEHPDAVVVSYVNTDAEVKAESDYCCTSSNAVRVIRAIPPEKEILFLPDMFLGAYLEKVTGRKMHVWMGECHVHAGIRPEHINRIRENHPNADLLIHPECGCVTSCMYYLADSSIQESGTHILSTEGMVKHVRSSSVEKEFAIATEVGILHRLRKEAPGATVFPVLEDAYCEYMKLITLEKVAHSLRNEVYQVTVPPRIAERARTAIERMLELA